MEFNLLMSILALGILWGFILKFVLSNLLNTVNKIKAAYKMSKLYKQKEAGVAKMKADGEFHEWITLQGVTESVMVCKKTGWSPDLKGFIPMHIINAQVEKQKRDEEYKAFRNARVARLAKELGFDLSRMESVVEQIFSIKKDFALVKIDQLQQDLQTRASNVDKQN